MLALSSLSLALLQDPVNPTGADIHIIAICLIVIALFFLLVMVGSGIAAFKAMAAIKKMEAKIDSLEKKGEALLAEGKAKAYPIIEKVQEIIDDLQPKIKSVTSDVEAMSKTVRAKVEEIGVTVTQVNGTVQDANIKTRSQVQRVDGLVTGALNTTHDVSQKVQAGIKYPINQVAGWIAGLKTGLETLAKKSPFGKPKARPTSPYDL